MEKELFRAYFYKKTLNRGWNSKNDEISSFNVTGCFTGGYIVFAAVLMTKPAVVRETRTTAEERRSLEKYRKNGFQPVWKQ